MPVDALDFPYWLTKHGRVPSMVVRSVNSQGKAICWLNGISGYFPPDIQAVLQPSPVGRGDVAPRLGGVTIRAVLGLQHIAFCPKVLSVKAKSQSDVFRFRPKTPIWSG